MENASKALIMAGGVLIGILLLSLAVYLFIDFGTTSAKINDKNAQQQIVEFNSKFTSYEGKTNLTIYEVLTVAGYAKENNEYYKGLDQYKVEVVLIGQGSIQTKKEEEKISMIEADIDISKITGSLPIYQCIIPQDAYSENGRIKKIQFKRIS